jgi:D-3-phosphoglycerate dehydrogenase
VARVLLTQAIHPAAQARLQTFAEVVLAPGTGLATLRACAAGCAAVIVRAQLPADIFEAAPSLLGAVRHGAGVDMIPVDAATAHGVLVANVPGVNANAVAEHVLRSMLELARRSRDVTRELASGRSAGWARARSLADFGVELRGRSVGVVGFGHVGQAIARIAKQGFGMDVLATTRSTAVDPLLATACDLDALLAASDFVVLACPLTDATRGLIGATQLERMRTGAFLINVARGPVVQESALIDALRSRRLAGAALDVFDAQPPPDDHPYWQMPQVLMTPHVAGLTEDSMLAMGTAAINAVDRLLRGELPPHCVNPQALPAFLRRWAAARAA